MSSSPRTEPILGCPTVSMGIVVRRNLPRVPTPNFARPLWTCPFIAFMVNFTMQHSQPAQHLRRVRSTARVRCNSLQGDDNDRTRPSPCICHRQPSSHQLEGNHENSLPPVTRSGRPCRSMRQSACSRPHLRTNLLERTWRTIGPEIIGPARSPTPQMVKHIQTTPGKGHRTTAISPSYRILARRNGADAA